MKISSERRPSISLQLNCSVGYVFVHDIDYPRNVLIRRQLEAVGARVDVFSLERMKATNPYAPAYLRWLRLNLARYDVVVLAEFQVRYAGALKLALLGTKTIVVVDGFVGRHETVVGDWGLVARRSLRSLMYKAVDFVSILSADIFLIDTRVRANRVSRTLAAMIRRPQIFSLPVGLPAWAAGPHNSVLANRAGNQDKREDFLNILYYGNYIPLHGLETVLYALKEVTSVEWRLVLIGDGDLRAGMEDLVRRLGIGAACTFINPVPQEDLADWIAEADVVLGVFGRSRKASEVIANKVWQGLGSGRVVVTRRSEALDELSFVPQPQLFQVGDGVDEIAGAIEHIAGREVPVFPETWELLEKYVHEEFQAFMVKVGERLVR
ncbi:glycosyltransferase [Pseudarthrobacter sp. J64]|uniref:glycosyltransferase n=1 Tax=Pseudarthrobacter sp. J64 TaxID=3116485 RepID=UPI002E80E190|nr:glycosyltransferase [Pseudarthrobacter sp. J64]MEE2567936.1 glycosyltransferase [Pseudarthrobacter sp. J64]